MDTWILIRFSRYKSTDRLYVNRKDDREVKMIVKKYSLVLLETLFMKKQKTQK
jgi:hypothetical protein